MTTSTTTFTTRTDSAYGAVDVTDAIIAAITEWPDGPLLVSLRHTTAGLVLGPADEGQMRDYARFAEHGLTELAPFHHAHVQDEVRNGREHLLSAVVGTQLVLRITDGQLAIGRWQRVLLIEFDGPKDRHIDVASLGAG